MATTPSAPNQQPDSRKEAQADTQLSALQAQPTLIRIKKKLGKSAARDLKNGKYFPGQVSNMYQGLVASFGPTEKPTPLIISYEEKPPKKSKKKKFKYVEYNGIKVDREKYQDQVKDELKNYGITFPSST